MAAAAHAAVDGLLPACGAEMTLAQLMVHILLHTGFLPRQMAARN